MGRLRKTKTKRLSKRMSKRMSKNRKNQSKKRFSKSIKRKRGGSDPEPTFHKCIVRGITFKFSKGILPETALIEVLDSNQKKAPYKKLTYNSNSNLPLTEYFEKGNYVEKKDCAFIEPRKLFWGSKPALPCYQLPEYGNVYEKLEGGNIDKLMGRFFYLNINPYELKPYSDHPRHTLDTEWPRLGDIFISCNDAGTVFGGPKKNIWMLVDIHYNAFKKNERHFINIASYLKSKNCNMSAAPGFE